MTRPISDLDVPVSRLQADMQQLVTRQQDQRFAEGVAAEVRHQMDPADTAFAQLACDHPDKCAHDCDYPDWTPGGAR
ncbi:hypothetical protein SGLAM104S_01576 [Streptomyces glaucescens]